jgi:hypothetical protein
MREANMSRKAQSQEPKLTEYESRQVEKIAAWKAEYPNPFGEIFRRAAQPIAKVVEAVVPDQFALAAINAAYKASELSATRSDIMLQAGVSDLSELKHKPMEVCDALSRRVGTLAQGTAVVEGALTGAGGVWTTLLDVPLLFTLCIRTIIKTGHCYGYELDRPTDKAWVLGALAVALSSTKERRTELMARLREIEHLLLEETQEQVVVEETASLLTQIEVFEDVPVFGAATGALLNLSTAHRADVTARHLFQERWLRDQGKVDEIEPDPGALRVPALDGWSGAFARIGYTSIYGASFGASFPVYLLGAIFAPVTGSIRDGVRDGARAAVRGADGLLGANAGGNGILRSGRFGNPALASG